MSKNKKKQLYHLSHKFLGNKKLFHPRIPSNRYEGDGVYHPFLDDFIEEDDSIKRICVSNSIKGAFYSIEGDNIVKDKEYVFFVYHPEKPKAVSRDMALMMVPDAKESGEHWILRTTNMVYVGKVSFINGKYKWIEKK